MKKIITTLILLAGLSASSQVKIGDNPTTINSSAVLELESTNKGFLPPRVTLAQRDAIVSPATGLVVYNTTSNKLQTNIGTPASPVWESSGADTTTASNGLTLNGSDVRLGGTLTSATTINQNNNDLTLTTGTAKAIVDGTFQTTAAVYAKVRKATSLPIVWAADDYVVLITVSGNQNINLPAPGGTNTGRVLIIRNNSTEGGASGTYTITTNAPVGNSSLAVSRAQIYVSDGVSWYLVAGL